MDQSTVAFVKAVIAFLLLAGTGMGAVWLWLRARDRPLPELERLVEELRAENAQMLAELGGRITELEERFDFTERRLVQERRTGELPSSRVPTPV